MLGLKFKFINRGDRKNNLVLDLRMEYENRFWGYRNRILRVNLTNRTFSEETLNDELIRNYIASMGIKPIRLTPQSLKKNSFSKRFVRSVKKKTVEKL
jgi:hypothetical protein